MSLPPLATFCLHFYINDLKHNKIYGLLILVAGIFFLLLHTVAYWNSPVIIFTDVCLLLCITTLFYQIDLKFKGNQWIQTGFFYSLLIFTLLGVTEWIHQISIHSPQLLSLYQLFNLNVNNLLVLQSLGILLVALYLFSHRLMVQIATIGLSKYTRLLLLIGAIGMGAPLVIILHLPFQTIAVLLAFFIYVVLFDLFIDNQIPGITWFVIWILLFAIFTTALLYHFTPPENFAQRPLSFFSSIFLTLIFTVLLFYFLSRIFPNLKFPLIDKPSLRNRIQITVVLLTLFIFVVVGIVTVTFFQKNDPNWNQNRLEFISVIINVYAFLLLMTGAIAIIIANSITQPIVKVGNKLGHLQLGHNERIDWEGQDEIGELIAEYNRMIEKLAENTAKLKQSERESAWREMAKQVAHEIKNPLTPIKLSIQYLLRMAKENPQEIQPTLERVSETIIEQIEGLTRIATEFSNFAKMPKPENITFILNDVVRSVFQLFAENPSAETQMKLNITETPISIFADRNQIIRVLNNLINNALQAIPSEQVGEIDISLFEKEQMAIIKVSDNGCGIAAPMREKVFEPNFTTKSSGTGLGLALSKNIIEAAGGKIWLESEVNKGTQFFVELPIVRSTSII